MTGRRRRRRRRRKKGEERGANAEKVDPLTCEGGVSRISL
jgi:hypothetical protein